MRLVRVVDPQSLQRLCDPVLIATSRQAFTLSGLERLEGADYAQSWRATLS